MNAVTGDPVLCILIGAVVTWAAHSSVASVLLIMSLAYAHFITPAAAFALVLGANLGSAINPVFEGAKRDNPASYRLPLGNLDQPPRRRRRWCCRSSADRRRICRPGSPISPS